MGKYWLYLTVVKYFIKWIYFTFLYYWLYYINVYIEYIHKKIKRMNTIEQGLDLYKKALVDYLKWHEPIKQKIADIVKHEPTAMDWEMYTEDHEKETALSWNAELKGMEKVLGLSKEETEHYLQQAKEYGKWFFQPCTIWNLWCSRDFF